MTRWLSDPSIETSKALSDFSKEMVPLKVTIETVVNYNTISERSLHSRVYLLLISTGWDKKKYHERHVCFWYSRRWKYKKKDSYLVWQCFMTLSTIPVFYRILDFISQFDRSAKAMVLLSSILVVTNAIFSSFLV